MKIKVVLLALFGFLLVIAVPVTSNAVQISFDDVPNGTVINNTYSSKRVTFTNTCTNTCHSGPATNDAFAFQSPIARSQSNVVSAFPPSGCPVAPPTGSFTTNEATLTARFTCGPTQVSIWAIPDSSNGSGALFAYDSSNNLIDESHSSGNNNELLTVNAPPGQSIAYVDFGGGGTDTSAFDDLTFTGGTCDSTTVPTMTEWGMIIFVVLAGLGAVYFIRRQRRAER
jgi:hypothetical protein